MITPTAEPQELDRATIFAHTLLVGYRRTEVSHLTATLVQGNQPLRAVRFSYVGKGKRKTEYLLDDGTIRSVVLIGWGWPDVPERWKSDGYAQFHSFDEGWNRSFDSYLESVLARSPGALWLDLRRWESGGTEVIAAPISPAITTDTAARSEPGITLVEGAVIEVTLSRFERDEEARKACLDAKGLNCLVCGTNFGAHYGALGAGFIHVHHLVPLASIREEYEIDPVRDLVPVCPNCHAMLHRRNPPISLEELRRQLKGTSS